MTKETKKEVCIRVIDGGGAGFRRADVVGTEVSNLVKIGPVETIDELINFARGDSTGTKGIAYAMAGEIKDHNIVIKSPNIHLLDGIPLGFLTTTKLGKPAIVCNDMEAAVMGMAALLPDLTYFMGITWSSGIGLRFFKDGKIIAQSEGGHIPLDPSPYAPRCGCGIRGCAESILGGKALERRVKAETEALKINIPSDINPCTALDRAYQREEEWATSIYDLISTGMAQFLAGKINLLRLPAIVWKGTFAKCALPLIEQDIRSKMRSKLFNPKWADEVKFLSSPKPEEDGLIGAAQIFQSLK